VNYILSPGRWRQILAASAPVIPLLFLMVFLMMASPSVAQTMADMPTLEDIQKNAGSVGGADADKSRDIIYAMLGEFGKSPMTTVGMASSMLGKLFFVFNSVLFVVGISFIGYKTVMAVAVSAHEGEVLGRRLNGFWIPIRLGTGVFGMIPAFAGFSLAQSIMLSVGIIGIGLANMLATAAVQSADKFDVVIPPPGIATTSSPGSVDMETANALFAMNVCQLASNEYANIIMKGLSPLLSRVTMNNSGVAISGAGVDCGRIRIIDETDNVRKSGIWNAGFRNSAVNYDDIAQLATRVLDARRGALHSLQTQVAPIAASWFTAVNAGNLQAYPIQQLASIVSSVQAAEKQSIENQSGAEAKKAISAISTKAKKNMTDGGWMALGSWYSTFGESNAAVQSAVLASRLEIAPMDLSRTSVPDTIKIPLTALYVERNKTPDTCLFGLMDKNAIGNCSPGQSATKALVDALLDNTGGTKMVNPVIAAKNIGDWLLTGVGAVMAMPKLSDIPVIGGALSGAANIASKVPGVGKAAGFLAKLGEIKPDSMAGKIASTVLIGALVLGLVFAVYVPFIPFITWYTALVSYFASLIEGLIAAQVWAFSHLNDDGEGMGQKTERGYVYILNMLLRPGLMVMGFFFASAILTLMGTFFAQQFGPALANVQGDTFTGPFIMVGTLFVVMIVLVTLIQTVFNLIYEIPDRVIAWFGHGMEARLAQQMDSKTEGKAENASRWTGQALVARGPMA
jgi:conjugal transfer/type IV secretion protein DotA/TraY